MTILAPHHKTKALVAVVINYWIPGEEKLHVSTLDLSDSWETTIGMLVTQGGHETLEKAMLAAVPAGHRLAD